MATKVFLFSPGKSLEDVVEGVGAAVQSSFAIGLTVDLATNKITEGGGTRAVLKSEVMQAIRILEEFLAKDPGSDFG